MSVSKAAVVILLLVSGVPFVCGPARAQPVVEVTADIAPPPLPVYLQPPVPGPGYLWSPGYWDWEPAFGYYWVPGTWVLPPRPNLLWTPAYWGWNDGAYAFHRGYWGPVVGFYGGVVYGFGYTGAGFQGGYWNGGAFFYNRSVTNITNVNITTVYNQTVAANNTKANVSYNGGAGGTTARPTPQQTALSQQSHEPPTPAQTQQAGLARSNPALRLSANHGVPPIAATPQPHVFTGTGVIGALPGGRTPLATSPAIRQPATATPANALPSGNQLPAGRFAPTASQTPRPSGAKPLGQRPAAGMTLTPSQLLAPNPSAPPSGSMASRPDAALAQQRAAASQQRAAASQQLAAASQQRAMLQQQRAEQMGRQQAVRQQRMNIMPQRAAQAPRGAPPRMAKPAPQRFASRPAPRRGRR